MSQLNTPTQPKLPSFVPKADIVETKQGITLTLEVPGLSKEDLEIKVENSRLHIFGKSPAPEGKLWYSEYPVGHYERSFTLGEQLDPNSIQAKLEQGVLTLTLQPKPEAAPKSITIH